MPANNFVPQQRGGFGLDRFLDHVAFIDPCVLMTNVALKKNRDAVVRHPADDRTSGTHKEFAPLFKVSRRELRHVWKRRYDAGSRYSRMRRHPCQGLGMNYGS